MSDCEQEVTPLTDKEIKEVRAVLEEERRVKWLKNSIKVGSIWVAAVVGGIMVFWDLTIRIIKEMVGK